jgi:Rrf2 family protein
MKLSAQEDYGLRCLLQLGRQEEGASLTIAELAAREGLSAPNVAKIMRVLRKGGFVRSTRGQAGGYTLARPVEAVSVGEVLAFLGGRFFDPSFCEKHSGSSVLCSNNSDCSIRPVLRHLQDVVDQVLGSLTLKSLLRSEQEMTAVWANPRAVPLPMTGRPS